MMDKAFLRTLRVHLQKEALPKIVDESDLCEHIAQYVIAILGGRSSDPLEKLKETVKEKAREFLKDDTDDFTDDLFRYIEKNAPPPSESRAGSSNSRSKRKRSSNRDSSDRRRRYSPERENRDSRRESTRDRDSFKRKQRRSRYSERESREDRDSSKRDERDRKRDSDSRRSEREGEGGGGGRDHRDHRHRDDRGGGSRDRRNNGGRRLTITKRPQDPSRQEAPPRDTAGGSGRSDDSDGRGNDEEKPYDQERDRPDDRNPRHGWRGPEAMMRGGRRPPPMRGDFRHPPDNNNRGMGPGGRGAEDAPPWNEIRFNNMRQQERMREGGERGGRGGRGGGRGGGRYHRGPPPPHMRMGGPMYGRPPMGANNMPPRGMMGPGRGGPFPPMGGGGFNHGGFNNGGGGGMGMMGRQQQQQQQRFPGGGGNMQRMPGGRVNANNRRKNNNNQGGGRMPPPNPTNLFVENIPDPINNTNSLSRHFKRFGEIINIYVDQKNTKAYVQFKTHDQAKRAISSPAAVCGNRFIKVKWAWRNPSTRMSEQGKGGGRTTSLQQQQQQQQNAKPVETFEMKIKKEKMLQIIQARVVQKSLENQKRLLKVLANKDLKAKMRTVLKEKYDKLEAEIKKALGEARERKARVESLEKEAAEAAAAKGDSTPTTGNGEGAGTSTLEIDSLPQELQERGEEGLSTLLAEHFKAFGTVDKIELVKTSEEGGDEEDTGVISSVRVVFSSTAEATRAAREGKKLKELELKMAVVVHEREDAVTAQANVVVPEVEAVEFDGHAKKGGNFDDSDGDSDDGRNDD